MCRSIGGLMPEWQAIKRNKLHGTVLFFPEKVGKSKYV